MHLSEALALIQHAGWDSPTPAHWADLGCGDGVFTEALTRLLPPQSHVHAVDTDVKALFQVPDVPRRTISRLRLDFIQEP